MQSNPIITLTTDFGYKDPFAGIMKGVILNINPSATVVDITHNISPQNIIEASFVIETSFSSFPPKTIHVVVVDPAVGSARRPILVVTDRHYFIGPDNGVFSQIYKLTEALMVIHITSEHYFLSKRSSTFHGRDIFAPVAGWLSKNIDITKFGDPITDYLNTPLPSPIMPAKNIVEGEVVYIDHFGNAITNIQAQKIHDLLRNNPGGKLKVVVKDKGVSVKDYYSQAVDKGLYSLINSFGYLELFVNKGNASSDFGIAVGEKIGLVIS
ncbi:MAG: SAM-dependent chlorinase/fluorinase [Nitrospirota bacterium]